MSINIEHLLNADPNREPDMNLAFDMGQKASQDALHAIGRSAALCPGPMEAGIALMLGIQIAYHEIRRKSERQGGFITECWNKFERALGDDSNWDEDGLK